MEKNSAAPDPREDLRTHLYCLFTALFVRNTVIHFLSFCYFYTCYVVVSFDVSVCPCVLRYIIYDQVVCTSTSYLFIMSFVAGIAVGEHDVRHRPVRTYVHIFILR